MCVKITQTNLKTEIKIRTLCTSYSNLFNVFVTIVAMIFGCENVDEMRDESVVCVCLFVRSVGNRWLQIVDENEMK